MKTGNLVCPYSRCKQSFEQPVIVTDFSKLPRETYYACPHCMLRLELFLEDGRENFGHVHVKAIDGEEILVSRLEVGEKGRGFGEAVSSHQATRPSKSCKHFLGYLRSIPESAGIPDECAVCPNIMQCYIRKK